MITREEIDKKSIDFGIHSSNVQRDYVFGWVLAGIYSVSDLKRYLILKGGNGFRKGYFENTRFSNDLDFSTESALEEDFLGRELQNVCDFVHENSGVIFEKDKIRVEDKRRVDQSKKAYEIRLYFKDFYGNPDRITIRIRLDVTKFDKIYLPPQDRFIIHPY